MINNNTVRLLLAALIAVISVCCCEGYQIIIPPPSLDPSQHQTLLVISPGAFVPPEAYIDIAKTVQKNAPFQLWIGIMRFIDNLPNPLEFDTRLEELVQDVSFKISPKTFNKTSDVYLAGHSLGGTMSSMEYRKRSMAGLILWGSYLNGHHAYADLQKTAFTLGGEIDGLTRITRLALDFKQFKEDIEKLSNVSEGDLVFKPVIVIPKVTHSQFCNQSVKGDLQPEISNQEAYELIASFTLAYMIPHVSQRDPCITPDQRQKSIKLLQQGVSKTSELVGAFLKAFDLENSQMGWCNSSQVNLLKTSEMFTPALQQRIAFDNSYIDNIVSFAESKPSISIQNDTVHKYKLHTTSHNAYPLNPGDISTIPVSANSIACKMKSVEATSIILNITYQKSPKESCQHLNDIAFDLVKSWINQEAFTRYLSRGYVLESGEDNVKGSGLTWLSSDLDIEKNEDKKAVVRSPVLKTDPSAPFGLGGMHYCKLLSPAKLVEWILVDSMK